jgi:hypothetical protein
MTRIPDTSVHNFETIRVSSGIATLSLLQRNGGSLSFDSDVVITMSHSQAFEVAIAIIRALKK